MIGDFISNGNNMCLLNVGSYAYLHLDTGTFTSIDLSLCSPNIRIEIDFMVESDSYGSDHFPIIFLIGGSLLDASPGGISVRMTGRNLIICVKRNLQ